MFTTSFKKVAARVVPFACLLLICGLATVQSDAQLQNRARQQPLLSDADAGVAQAKVQDQLLSLSNRMMEAQWSVREGKLTGLKFVIQGTGAEVELPRDPFLLIFKDGSAVRASEMTLTDGPRVEALRADPDASRAAEHFAGHAIRCEAARLSGKIFGNVARNSARRFQLCSAGDCDLRAKRRFADCRGALIRRQFARRQSDRKC